MYWLASRNFVVSIPKCRSPFSLFSILRSPSSNYCSFSRPLPTPHKRRVEGAHCFKDVKVSKGNSKATRKVKALDGVLGEKDLTHLLWWKEKLENCKKPSTHHLIKRLVYTNLLGVDANLRNGSLKEGNLNWEMLQFKSKFPREVLLCRVGDFYESVGVDACILVEYAGLNPFGGLRSDSIPKAGCPVVVFFIIEIMRIVCYDQNRR